MCQVPKNVLDHLCLWIRDEEGTVGASEALPQSFRGSRDDVHKTSQCIPSREEEQCGEKSFKFHEFQKNCESKAKEQ